MVCVCDIVETLRYWRLWCLLPCLLEFALADRKIRCRPETSIWRHCSMLIIIQVPTRGLAGQPV